MAFTGADRQAIKRAVGPQVEILAATVARVYNTALRADRWSYLGHEGALVLLRDRQLSNSIFLRLVHLSSVHFY